MNPFSRLLADKIEGYITLRRSLGYVFQSQAATLRAFCHFVEGGNHPGPLTGHLALTFVLSCPVTPPVRARRYGVLRRFAEYFSVFDIRTQRFDARVLPRSRAIAPPRILDAGELAQLLGAARELSPRYPMRGRTLHTMIGLLASTGLRSGEALRLDRTDVDIERGIIAIRRTKFRKDRMVPIHETMRTALAEYAVLRDTALPQCTSSAFFPSTRGGRFSTTAFGNGFREACAAAGLDAGASRPLRPHDLRHRFAATRLVTWHREGVDVQVRLPLLATYPGHVHYTDTACHIERFMARSYSGYAHHTCVVSQRLRPPRRRARPR
jgi:integrase